MQYYPIQKNWSRKIKPHLQDLEAQYILRRDFNKYTFGRWKQEFKLGMKPTEFESCDWRYSHGRRGKQPEFWDCVKHAACHWLVNFNRRLAELSEPKIKWRIVSSELHSTTWDSKETLFDMNFLALGVSAEEAWKLASEHGTILDIGEEHFCNFAQYSRDEMIKEKCDCCSSNSA
jgi:hypothetical protein